MNWHYQRIHDELPLGLLEVLQPKAIGCLRRQRRCPGSACRRSSKICSWALLAGIIVVLFFFLRLRVPQMAVFLSCFCWLIYRWR